MKKEIIALALTMLLAGCVLFSQPPQPISEKEFKELVATRENFALFMNTTGANAGNAVTIYQCGADLSGSLGLLGKNITVYAIEGDACVSPAANSSFDACLSQAQGRYLFFIQRGSSSPEYYATFTRVFVPENYSSACRIAVRYGLNETT